MPNWTNSLIYPPLAGRQVPRPKKVGSPYFDVPMEKRRHVTRDLLDLQPMSGPELIDAVISSWGDIFRSQIGVARIGVDIQPAPQIMGYLLHELIPLTISKTNSDWRRDGSTNEKDLVYIPNEEYSIEIKTSSDKGKIWGNRSFGQDTDDVSKKAKSGYYCAVNFQKWRDSPSPKIQSIRYGWLDSTDWIGQAAASGQKSSIPDVIYNTQLPQLYKL